MDIATAHTLSRLTSDFYAQVSLSFSETRQAAWEGWQRVLEVARLACVPQMRVLDVGCGNLRFERFLAERVEEPHVLALDNCAPLVRAGIAREEEPAETADVANAPLEAAPPAGFALPAHIQFHQADLAQALLKSCHVPSDGARRATAAASLEARPAAASPWPDAPRAGARQLEGHSDADDSAMPLGAPANWADLSVAFGFAHHLPLPAQRQALLRALVEATRPGGYVAVSFWQFARSEKLLAKARAATAEGRAALGLAPFDENDYLLGWQQERGVYRFCHHFPEEEINELAHGVAHLAREAARFSADGKTHDLNRYLMLRVI